MAFCWVEITFEKVIFLYEEKKKTPGSTSTKDFDCSDLVLCEKCTTSFEKLQEEVDSKFKDKHKQSVALSDIYRKLDLSRRADRVEQCGTFLEFHVFPNDVKLQYANFCKDRLCPMCNWRRSMKIFSQVSKVMDHMQGYQFLFLTLTVKNCSAADLPKTVQVLFDGWRYLYNKNKEFKSVIHGTFRSLEITRNKKNGTFHPHLHCILAVKPSYFKKGYISQKRWSELWCNACDLDYNPIVHITKIKDTGKGISGAVVEVSKYSAKGIDYIKSVEATQALLGGISGRRLCGWTGIFAKIRKQLELDDVEDGDLVHTDDDAVREDLKYLIVRCHWKAGIYHQEICFEGE